VHNVLVCSQAELVARWETLGELLVTNRIHVDIAQPDIGRYLSIVRQRFDADVNIRTVGCSAEHSAATA